MKQNSCNSQLCLKPSASAPRWFQNFQWNHSIRRHRGRSIRPTIRLPLCILFTCGRVQFFKCNILFHCNVQFVWLANLISSALQVIQEYINSDSPFDGHLLCYIYFCVTNAKKKTEMRKGASAFETQVHWNPSI